MAVVLSSILASCTSGDVVARIPSPDRNLEAIVVEDSGDATTDFLYLVCIVSPGSNSCEKSSAAATLYGARRNNRSAGVDVEWTDEHHVIVKYMKAKTVAIPKPIVSDKGVDIYVELRSNVINDNAPDGSMWNALNSAKKS